MQTEKTLSIGIDLGTTYSCVGVFKGGKVEIIANDQGNRTTPSFVAFTDTEKLVGESAKSQISKNPSNTVYDIKRIMGLKYNDKNLQKELKNFSYKITDDNNQPKVNVMYKGEEQFMAPEQISSFILSKMKEISESYLGYTVSNAVITVPAYFSDEQRNATKDAGMLAGLNVLRIINEPTAAAIAYGLQKSNENGDDDRNILVFDLGGGTFDVSILSTSDNFFEVRSTSGDTHLGGEDFDNRMVDFLLDDFEKKHNKHISKDKSEEKDTKAIRRLKAECEKVKKILSSSQSANIDLDSFYDGVDYSFTFTRAKFEELCKDLFNSCLEPVSQALLKAKMGKDEINNVVLVGGSTRIPKIRSLLSDYFNCSKGTVQINSDINPDEAIAYGATVMAALISGDKSETIKDIVLVDVASLDIGVEVEGDMVQAIIKSGTAIPINKTQVFSTTRDNQEEVKIKIYEGIGRPAVRDNTLLGEFEMSGIPKMKRGEPKIEISLDIDVNGVLTVSANVQNTEIKNEIKVTNRSRYSKEEIEKMKEEAEKFKKDDEEFKECVGVKNDMERLLGYVMEQTESETFKNLPEETQTELKSKLEEYQKWYYENQSAKLQEFKDKLEEMQKALADYTKDMSSAPESSGLQNMMGGMPKDFDPSKFQEILKNMTPEQMEEMTKQMGSMMGGTTTDETEPELDQEGDLPQESQVETTQEPQSE